MISLFFTTNPLLNSYWPAPNKYMDLKLSLPIYRGRHCSGWPFFAPFPPQVSEKSNDTLHLNSSVLSTLALFHLCTIPILDLSIRLVIHKFLPSALWLLTLFSTVSSIVLGNTIISKFPEASFSESNDIIHPVFDLEFHSLSSLISTPNMKWSYPNTAPSPTILSNKALQKIFPMCPLWSRQSSRCGASRNKQVKPLPSWFVCLFVCLFVFLWREDRK